jgi:hypothetical protein
VLKEEVETPEDESLTGGSIESIPNTIIIVTNWFEELKKKMPGD